MFTKDMIAAMIDDFYKHMDTLNEHSIYLKEAMEDVRKRLGKYPQATENEMNGLNDDLVAVVQSSALLGYYIGLQKGADFIQTLSSPNLPEQMLKAFGEWE